VIPGIKPPKEDGNYVIAASRLKQIVMRKA
jgi:hypothetical protein